MHLPNSNYCRQIIWRSVLCVYEGGNAFSIKESKKAKCVCYLRENLTNSCYFVQRNNDKIPWNPLYREAFTHRQTNTAISSLCYTLVLKKDFPHFLCSLFGGYTFITASKIALYLYVCFFFFLSILLNIRIGNYYLNFISFKWV